MLKFHFRIGAKLAITAIAGVFLVVAMIGNQARVNRVALDLAAEANSGENLEEEAFTAKIALRHLIQIDREIQLAAAPRAVESILVEGQRFTNEGNKALDAAEAAAVAGDARHDLELAKEAFNGYSATLRELAALQLTIIGLREDQITEGLAWDKKLALVLTNGAVLTAGNRFSFLSAIKGADLVFKQAQLESWSRFVRSDEHQMKRLYANLDEVVDLLKASRQMTTDRSAIAVIDELLVFPHGYRAIIDKLTMTAEAQNNLLRTRANPLQDVAVSRLTEVVRIVSARVNQLSELSGDELRRAQWVNLFSGGFVILVLVGSAIFIAVGVGRPIQHVGDFLTQLARGDKAVHIPYADRRDEIGDAARAALTFKDYLLRMEGLETEKNETEAQAAGKRKAEMALFADEFQAAIGSIVDTVSQAASHLETTAAALAGTADTTHQLSSAVVKAAEDTSSNVASIATASDELAASVAETGRQVFHSSSITSEAVKQAEQTDAQISELSRAAQHISEVLKLITDIAEQTNLLALNATIEAARAGVSGKGFAVVASEVKMLANQSAKAAEEIGDQIAGMQSATNNSVSAIKGIGATIRHVSEIATSIASAVEQQGSAMQEMAHNIHQASQATTQVVTNIHDVNRGASETGAASAQVLSSARGLADQGKNLKIEADKFLAKVRTG